MEVLSLVEHETVPVVKTRNRGDKAITTEQAAHLARLEGKIPQKVFSWGHRQVKFSQYCGVISLGNISLEILPKIYGLEADPGASRRALIRMLVKARKIKLNKAGSATVSLQKHHLLDIFILHFCDQLNAQLTQGMIQTYEQRTRNLGVLRGRLLIEQQLKHNLAHRERLFCQYDELSIDNPHNQVIKFVLSRLIRASTGSSALKAVTELLMRFDSVSNIPVNIRSLDALSFDRTTQRYEGIIQQCRWFLQGLHPDVLAGKEECLSLLFDMNRLFESYVAAVLRPMAWKSGYRLREQGPQRYMAVREDIGQKVFLMKPDISLIDESGNVVVIADAKWKILDEEEKKLGLSQGDLYQIESYAANYGVRKLVLVYPKQKNLKNPVKIRLLGLGADLLILPIDLTTDGSKLNRESFFAAL